MQENTLLVANFPQHQKKGIISIRPTYKQSSQNAKGLVDEIGLSHYEF
ncbi:MAG: hypothetical protein MUE91_09880 [Ignavibacteriaceae bacterium]|jgi:hypothetical protein|nr:hypothetical protein [Ignavibacteriaceae bacterium]